MFYMRRLRLVETVNFGFWIISIRVRIQKLAETIYTCQEEKTDARDQTSIQLMSDGEREDLGPQDGPKSKNIQHVD